MTTVCVERGSIQAADPNESYGQKLSRRFKSLERSCGGEDMKKRSTDTKRAQHVTVLPTV